MSATLFRAPAIAAIILAVSATCLLAAQFGAAAYADEASDVLSTATAVEESTKAYDDAVKRVEEVDAKIAELSERAASLQEKLPAQRAASNGAFVAMYKMQQEGYSLLDALLSSESIGDFFRRLEYITRVQNAHQEALMGLINMQKELDDTNTSLQEQKKEADDQRAAAQEALNQARAAHQAAQSAAEVKRRAEEQSLAGKNPRDIAVNKPSDANGGSQANGDAPSSVAPPSSDGADWSGDKTAFVNGWAGRIDAYLAGSNLAGYGRNFATAAWDYGVDPRWSPAIACIESGKGAQCFRAHNAWGWGNINWGSWEEAIDSHVRGLSRGYGYTISVQAAQKYCPPNWSFWYDRVSSEMNRI